MPSELWRHFRELNRIPRSSGHEEAAREYVQRVATGVDAEYTADAAGNIVVRVPAVAALDNVPSVAVQAHLDMVCETEPHYTHDFRAEGIRPIREGDRIYAEGTTLGADNGIGVAAALTLMTTSNIHHGPLELLFTVEEETGLQGALALDPALLTAQHLINLDSEDPEEITIGSAGGLDLEIFVGFRAVDLQPERAVVEVAISNLHGGHSGIDIDRPHANALKLLGALLTNLAGRHQFHLCSIRGGSARNAIPRQASANISTAWESQADVMTHLHSLSRSLCETWEREEPALSISINRRGTTTRQIDDYDRDVLLYLLQELPHGVLTMSASFPSKVDTSSNLAQVESGIDGAEFVVSVRSLREAALDDLAGRVRSIARRRDAKVQVRNRYPSWTPDASSRLLDVTSSAYEDVYHHGPQIQVMHAGLECGVIVAKVPGMQAVSIGPRIVGAHTPKEHVYASSVLSTWKLLIGSLKALSRSVSAE